MTTQFYYRSKISSVLLHNKRYVKQDFHQTFMQLPWAKSVSVPKAADFMAWFFPMYPRLGTNMKIPHLELPEP